MTRHPLNKAAIAECSRRFAALAPLLGLAGLVLAGCGPAVKPEPARPDPAAVHALIERLLPPDIPDRTGWVSDVYVAFESLDVAPTPAHVCAVAAVAGQESNYETDPAIPGLPTIAMKEIDERARHAGVPAMVVHAALRLPSPDGRSYSERIEAARTERDLNDIYEDLVGVVPLGGLFLSDRNPIRTAGPMQVSVSFSEAYAEHHRYPYPVQRSLRHEVFTRHGSVYFGTAHLLDYPVSYDQMLYRFADYNAGQYASRNAAFQNALSIATGVPLAADGELLRLDDSSTNTELAAQLLGKRVDLSEEQIHDDLRHSRSLDFEETALYKRVYALAEQAEGHALPRAQLPQIDLKSPKISHHLTTAWYANRVEWRYRKCLGQGESGAAQQTADDLASSAMIDQESPNAGWQ